MGLFVVLPTNAAMAHPTEQQKQSDTTLNNQAFVITVVTCTSMICGRAVTAVGVSLVISDRSSVRVTICNIYLW